VVGALVGGSLSDRVGRRAILFASILTTPLLMFAFLVVTGWPRVPLLLLIGFAALSIGPVIMALVQETSPESRALANGVYMALSFVIRSVVIVLVGAMGDLFSLRIAFATSGVVTLLGLPLILFLPSTAGRSR
jgi:FSR family fosmidomycin resistance protein-like MFS transporter